MGQPGAASRTRKESRRSGAYPPPSPAAAPPEASAPPATPARPKGPPVGRLAARPRPLPRRALRSGLPATVAQPHTTPSQRRPRPDSGSRPSTTPAANAAEVAAAAPAVTRALSSRGAYWEVTYDGHTTLVEGSRGLSYIALLVQRGMSHGGPIHAKELVALATGHDGEPIELELPEPLLDAVAQQQLVDRLRDIAAERERACAVEDFDRAAALDDEHERIANQLSRARSPKGRRGSTFDHAGERARKAVAKAISEAIGRLQAHDSMAALAAHLTSAIRKGQWLSYDGHGDWQIQLSGPLPRK